MGHYFLIKAGNVSAKDEDVLSGFFFQHQAEGVSEDLKFSQLDAEYSVQTLDSDFKDLSIYFSVIPDEDILFKAKGLFPDVRFQVEKKIDKDWLTEWKKGFVEFVLVDGVQVVPSWLKPAMSSSLNIFIDPGMAFGTGTHDTTQIAAGLIKELDLNQKTVADIGTGTGILAVLCEKLNASSVEATEIDEIARQVACENVQLNNCSRVNVKDVQVEELVSTYDLVIANIIDGVLIKIQKDLSRIVKPGGQLLLTGILQEREAHFLESFDLSRFKVLKKVQQQEWLGFLLQKI